MVQEVKTEKTAFGKNLFDKSVDKTFSTFVTGSEATFLTVEQFFSEYERLYLTIPIEGIINSHSYLVRKSSELTGSSEENELIQNLLDEIANLREQLLEANQTIVELRTSIAVDGN